MIIQLHNNLMQVVSQAPEASSLHKAVDGIENHGATIEEEPWTWRATADCRLTCVHNTKTNDRSLRMAILWLPYL